MCVLIRKTALGGMFLSLAERPSDLVELVNKMDPDTRRRSQDFCEMQT